MIRLIVIILLALAAFWCYNNVNLSNVADQTISSIKNEKTIKAVNDKRAFDHEREEAVMRNE